MLSTYGVVPPTSAVQPIEKPSTLKPQAITRTKIASPKRKHRLNISRPPVCLHRGPRLASAGGSEPERLLVIGLQKTWCEDLGKGGSGLCKDKALVRELLEKRPPFHNQTSNLTHSLRLESTTLTYPDITSALTPMLLCQCTSTVKRRDSGGSASIFLSKGSPRFRAAALPMEIVGLAFYA